MMRDKPLTGRHVLAITLGAFGLVIAVNMALLFAAVGTFPGLEVKNSYVASQQFDDRRAAQQALGWQSGVAYDEGMLTLRLDDLSGSRADARGVAGWVGRPTHSRDDRELAFVPARDGWRAVADLEPGKWHINVSAVAADMTAFRQQLSIFVPEDR